MNIQQCRDHAYNTLEAIAWEVGNLRVNKCRSAIFGILVQFFAQEDITVEATSEKIQEVLQTDEHYDTIFGAIHSELRLIDLDDGNDAA